MAEPDLSGWSCPAPLRHHERVTTGHGGGGRLSADLLTHLLRPSLGVDTTAAPLDAAIVEVAGERVAFTTDSYVVRPLFFPGGSIGQLAVNGTVNDLAMAGAVPLALSCALILEEGLPLATLAEISTQMGAAARRARVPLVTGDTKVVGAGLADGLYVNTAGIGLVPAGVDLRPERAAPGDRVLLSGPIGLHGIAVMSVREGLDFATGVRSDTAPLAGLVAAMLAAAPPGDIKALRDPTRGGLAASLCELAQGGGVGIEYREQAVPVPAEVRAACELLGLDPMHVANEGRLVAVVAPGAADAVLDAMRADPAGAQAVAIGTVGADHPGIVAARTALGTLRIVDLPLGEQLPRIC